MKDKLIQNKNIIILIAAIVACALLVPSFIGILGNEITSQSVTSLVISVATLLANLFFIFCFITKKDINKKLLIIPIAIFEGALLVGQIYSIIQYNSWSSIYYAALYAAVIIIYVIYFFKSNSILKITLYILFAICMAFDLLNVFQGSNVDFSRLITNLIFIGNLYLISEEGEQQ